MRLYREYMDAAYDSLSPRESIEWSNFWWDSADKETEKRDAKGALKAVYLPFIASMMLSLFRWGIMEELEEMEAPLVNVMKNSLNGL